VDVPTDEGADGLLTPPHDGTVVLVPVPVAGPPIRPRGPAGRRRDRMTRTRVGRRGNSDRTRTVGRPAGPPKGRQAIAALRG
jgi:hypothetical protein